ncbi:MAG TPA: hypothetical protein VMB81_08575 [Candidatus Sulfotelmatobacter sp.]|nr:hypothetical protein [Candidatus Sulfotelmatobacter sp.]
MSYFESDPDFSYIPSPLASLLLNDPNGRNSLGLLQGQSAQSASSAYLDLLRRLTPQSSIPAGTHSVPFAMGTAASLPQNPAAATAQFSLHPESDLLRKLDTAIRALDSTSGNRRSSWTAPGHAAEGQSDETQVAAGGDLMCQGVCSMGGTYGTTGMYTIGGRVLCPDCAAKAAGVADEPAAEKVRVLTPFLLQRR